MTEPRYTVAVVGAGFSGTLVAAHLLRRAAGPLRVLLVNRSGPMGRGVAYGTRTESHVLNVPAGRMSAFVDDEDDFLRFAQRRLRGAAGGTFVPRRLYGEYLEHVLSSAESSAVDGATLERVVDEVVSLDLCDDGASARLRFADGRVVRADRVVLALGNFAPADPQVDTPEFYRSPRYVRDPWSAGALDVVQPGEPVLLIGTGLTMLDIALDLQARGAGRMLAVARRGLLPLPHRSPSVPPASDHRPPDILTGPATALAYLKAVRAHVARLAAAGVDWREVIGSLRPITPQLWARLGVRERARFLRHLRVYWDVHRHRTAPELDAALRGHTAAGRLAVVAGRVLRYGADEDGVTVTLQRRGASTPELVRVARVLNCTGPDADVRRLSEPLIASLRDRGLLMPDALGLGVETADDGALLDRHGLPSRVLHHVGPLLKARYWEATAVPELRVHAERAASSILSSLEERELEAV